MAQDQITERDAKLKEIAADVTAMIKKYGRRKDVYVSYFQGTEEDVAKFSEWDRRRLSIWENREIFLVCEDSGHLLYSVHVEGDSYLTALDELVRLVAAKF